MRTVDVVFSRGLIVLVVIEYFADQQQWGESLTAVWSAIHY